MDGLIVKSDIEDSGTTNITGLTWVRSGNIVTVSAYDVDTTANVSITGLPKPKSSYIIGILLNSSDIVGAIQCISSWSILKIGSGNAHSYGTFTYITE